MRQVFDSSVPLHEQLQRTAGMKKVGHKHNHTKGPCRPKKNTAARDQKRSARWRKYREQVALYFRGFLDQMPKRPDEA